MNFKQFILKNKKFAASIIVGLFFGTSFGIVGTVSKDEYAAHNEEKNAIISQIEEQQEVLNSNSEELTTLLAKEADLKKQKEDILEKQRLAKEEAERKAKEEAEAIAKAKAEEERLAKEEAERLAREEAERVAANNAYYSNNDSYNNDVSESEPVGQMVYKTKTGSKYHSHNNCGNTNSANTTYITLEQAQNLGLTACSKCY